MKWLLLITILIACTAQADTLIVVHPNASEIYHCYTLTYEGTDEQGSVVGNCYERFEGQGQGDRILHDGFDITWGMWRYHVWMNNQLGNVYEQAGCGLVWFNEDSIELLCN